MLLSTGLLCINMLIFYLYNALFATCLNLEENAVFERQIVGYSKQLEILIQSGKKISALRHDMKHHLNELMIMEEKDEKKEVVDNIQNGICFGK